MQIAKTFRIENKNKVDRKINNSFSAMTNKNTPRILNDSTLSKLGKLQLGGKRLQNDLQIEAQLVKMNLLRVNNNPLKKSSRNTTNMTSNIQQGLDKISFEQSCLLKELSISVEDGRDAKPVQLQSESIDYSRDTFNKPFYGLSMPTTPAINSQRKRINSIISPRKQKEINRANIFTPPPVNFKKVDWSFDFSNKHVSKKSALGDLLSYQRENAKTTLNWDLNEVTET